MPKDGYMTSSARLNIDDASDEWEGEKQSATEEAVHSAALLFVATKVASYALDKTF